MRIEPNFRCGRRCCDERLKLLVFAVLIFAPAHLLALTNHAPPEPSDPQTPQTARDGRPEHEASNPAHRRASRPRHCLCSQWRRQGPLRDSWPTSGPPPSHPRSLPPSAGRPPPPSQHQLLGLRPRQVCRRRDSVCQPQRNGMSPGSPLWTRPGNSSCWLS